MHSGCALREFAYLVNTLRVQGVQEFRLTIEQRYMTLTGEFNRLKRTFTLEDDWVGFRVSVVQEDVLMWTLYESVCSIRKLCEVYPTEYVAYNIDGLKELIELYSEKLHNILMNVDDAMTVVEVHLLSPPHSVSPHSFSSAE